MHLLDRRILWRSDRSPDQSICALGAVVREPWQVSESLRFSSFGALQPKTAQSMATGFGNDDPRFVCRQCKAVGEHQAAQKLFNPSIRVKAKQPSGRQVLYDVPAPVVDGVARTGNTEINGSVLCSDHIAAKSQWPSRILVHQCSNLSIARIEIEQPLGTVTNQDVPVC